MSNRIRELEIGLTDAQTKLKDSRNTIDELEQKIESLGNAEPNENAEAADSEQIQQLQDKNNALNDRIAELETQIEPLTNENVRLKEELSGLESVQTDLQEKTQAINELESGNSRKDSGNCHHEGESGKLYRIS